MLQTLKQRSGWFAKAMSRSGETWNGMRLQLRYRQPAATAKPLRQNVLYHIHKSDAHFRHLSFTASVIALSARVACIDGALTSEKYLAFRDAFPLKGSLCNRIRSLFTLACQDTTPIEHYVQRIKYLYPERKELHITLLERLFQISSANGAMSRPAERLLASIAHALQVSPTFYHDIRQRHLASFQAHRVLSISKQSEPSVLKKRYHELMKHYHPDRFSSDDLSPELERLLQLRASEINEAYRVLKRNMA